MSLVPAEVLTPLERIAKDARTASRTKTDGEREYFEALAGLRAEVSAMTASQKVKTALLVRLQGLEALVTEPKQAAEWHAARITEDAEKAVSAAKVEVAAAAVSSMAQRVGLKVLSSSDESVRAIGVGLLTQGD